MELLYKQMEGKSVAVVYKGASSDALSHTTRCNGASSSGLSHTIRCKDGSEIVVRDRNLKLLKQPDFTNIQNNSS